MRGPKAIHLRDSAVDFDRAGAGGFAWEPQHNSRGSASAARTPAALRITRGFAGAAVLCWTQGAWLDSLPASDELPGYGQGKTHSKSITCDVPGGFARCRGFNLSCGFTLMLLGHPGFSSGLLK